MEGARKARSELFLVVSGREAGVREVQKAVLDVRNRKSAMFDTRKPKIGHARHPTIENGSCSTFDTRKSKIGHARRLKAVNRPCSTLEN